MHKLKAYKNCKGFNSLPQSPVFKHPLEPGLEPCENIVGKGEIAGNQNFLLFPQFSTLPTSNFKC